MNKKIKKYIIVLLTLVFSAALCTITAFAQSGITPEDDSSSPTSSTYESSSSAVSSGTASEGETDSTPVSDGTGSVDIPQDNESITVKLDYNNGSDIKVITVEPGTLVGSLAVPSRKGYVFSYWTMNGAKVASSFEIYTEISLTAHWEVSTDSSQKASSYASVDTHQEEVEQAASRAEAAISDPDTLSSEDWNSILSAGSSSSQSGSSSSASSSASTGGGSWLFPVGIILIILSACGIGAFIYLQFFSGRSGPRGPHSGSGHGGNADDITEFTDISSNSDDPNSEAVPKLKQSPGSPRRDTDDTMPLPPQIQRTPPRTPKAQHWPAQTPPSAKRRPEQYSHDMSQSQAKPVNGEKGEKKDFDWDKFFNDDI